MSQDFHAPAVTCIGQQVISEVSREEDRAARSLFKAEPYRPGRTGCELVRQLPQGSGQDEGLVGRHEQIACRIRIQVPDSRVHGVAFPGAVMKKTGNPFPVQQLFYFFASGHSKRAESRLHQVPGSVQNDLPAVQLLHELVFPVAHRGS